MSFGRQPNMIRRAARPDETFHRDRRRKGLDRAGMLEAKTRRRSQSLLARIIAAFLRKRGRGRNPQMQKLP